MHTHKLVPSLTVPLLLLLTLTQTLTLAPHAVTASTKPATHTLKLGFIWPDLTTTNAAGNETGAVVNEYDEGGAPRRTVAYGEMGRRTMEAAVHWVNRQPDILPNTHIDLITYESGTEKWEAMQAAYQVVNQNVFAVVGPAYTSQAVYSGLVTAGYNIPNCLADAGGSQFEDRTSYPNIFRMQLSSTRYGARMVDFVHQMGWKNIAYIYSAADLGSSFGKGIISSAHKWGIKILVQQGFNADGLLSDAELDSVVKSVVQSRARVVVVSANEVEATALWIRAYRNGIIGPDSVWITSSGVIDFAVGLYSSAFYQPLSIAHHLGTATANAASVYMEISKDADYTTQTYLVYKTEYETLFPPVGDAADLGYLQDDRLWDCAMAIFHGFDQVIKSNSSLDVSMLVNPDFTEPKLVGDVAPAWDMQPFTNITIFNTGKPGFHGPLMFDEQGDTMSKTLQMVVQVNGEVNAELTQYPVVSEMVGSTSNPILTPSNLVFFGNSLTLPSDLPPPTRHNPTWASPQGIIFSTLSALLLASHLTAIVVTYRNRNVTVIKRGSWKSLVLILVGLVWVGVAPLLYLGDMSAAVCGAQPFILNVGFGIVFANLGAKTWRVYRIFNNPKMMAVVIPDSHVLGSAAAIVLIEFLLSLIWVLTSAPLPIAVSVTDSEVIIACMSPNGRVQNVMTAISIVFNGILLTATTMLSYRNRKVVSEYNETKWIGMAVYNIVVVCAVFIPLVYTTTFASYHYLLRSIAVVVGTGVTSLCIFGPKFLVLFRNQTSIGSTGAQGTNLGAVRGSGIGSGTGSSSTNAKTTAAFSALTSRSPTTNTHKLNGLHLSNVPTLVSAGGSSIFSFSFLARWKIATVIALPGYICIDFPATDGSSTSGKTQIYRTANAIIRSEGTGEVSSIAADGAVPTPMQHTSDMAEKGVDSGLSTLTIVTLDGTLEFVLSQEIASDLLIQIRTTANPPLGIFRSGHLTG